MKKIFFFAAAAAMMAACSENDQLALNQDLQSQQDKGIQFSVYTNRAVTRAGQAGSLNTEALKEGDGIGVFAYHTNNSKYDERTSLPNFMYNQNVKFDAANNAWTYDPVKYWPNEFGKNAVSEDIDYVSFFAYAPYVAVNPTTGIPVVNYEDFDAEKFAAYLGYKAGAINDGVEAASAVEDFRAKEGYKEATETGDDAIDALKMLFAKQQQGKNITSITRNGDKGDPIVRYVVDTNPQTSVDLLWGVAADGDFQGLADGQAAITAGNCYLDLSKQIGTTDSIKWKFYHALSKLNVQIIAAADVVTEGTEAYAPEEAEDLAKATKIYLRSIDFTGFATRGALNLHSEEATVDYKVKPNWMNYDGTDLTAGNVTFYDGLKDCKEGYTDNINTNENPRGLNPVLIEEPTTTTWADKQQGIPTTEYVNLFAGAIDDPETEDNEATTAPIFVIPTNERMTITVVYDIMTRDTLLSQNLSDGFTKGSRVQNKISQTLQDLKLEAGKAYTIKLVVGIESVKVTVEVEDWTDYEGGEQKVDLPYNPQGAEEEEPTPVVPEEVELTAGNTYKYKKSETATQVKTSEVLEENPQGEDGYIYNFTKKELDKEEVYTFDEPGPDCFDTVAALFSSEYEEGYVLNDDGSGTYRKWKQGAGEGNPEKTSTYEGYRIPKGTMTGSTVSTEIVKFVYNSLEGTWTEEISADGSYYILPQAEQ